MYHKYFVCVTIFNLGGLQEALSWVLLLRQIWIVINYVKCLSDNLSNEIKNTDVSREMILQKHFILAFQFMFCLETFILDYWGKNMSWKSTIIWRNNWHYIICWSRRTWLYWNFQVGLHITLKSFRTTMRCWGFRVKYVVGKTIGTKHKLKYI